MAEYIHSDTADAVCIIKNLHMFQLRLCCRWLGVMDAVVTFLRTTQTQFVPFLWTCTKVCPRHAPVYVAAKGTASNCSPAHLCAKRRHFSCRSTSATVRTSLFTWTLCARGALTAHPGARFARLATHLPASSCAWRTQRAAHGAASNEKLVWGRGAA